MDVTYDRLSGSLGSLLLLWARIERSARAEVAHSDGSLPKSAHGIAAVLDLWKSKVVADQPATSLCPSLATVLRAELQAPLDIRNGLCHGLIGISMAREDMTSKLSWELKGKEQSISWEELQASFAWLSKVPHALSMISNPSLERFGSRAIDNAENREWWLTEFALRLPDE